MIAPLLALFALPMAALAAANTTATAIATYPAPTTGAIAGTGYISVVVDAASAGSISFTTATIPTGIVGCLNAAGQVVLDDCALFTAADATVASSAGTCSFYNAAAPYNTDLAYGTTDAIHAFSCYDHASVSTDTDFYTISGLKYNYVGQGDINLYYDVPSLPVLSTDAISFWPLEYTGSGPTVPTGHYEALLLWEPSS